MPKKPPSNANGDFTWVPKLLDDRDILHKDFANYIGTKSSRVSEMSKFMQDGMLREKPRRMKIEHLSKTAEFLKMSVEEVLRKSGIHSGPDRYPPIVVLNARNDNTKPVQITVQGNFEIRDDKQDND